MSCTLNVYLFLYDVAESTETIVIPRKKTWYVPYHYYMKVLGVIHCRQHGTQHTRVQIKFASIYLDINCPKIQIHNQ